MRTIEQVVYRYNELSEEAKEKARDWYRSACEFDYEYVYDDFEQICEHLGIELDSKRGRTGPAIYFTGFWSQGDGACFEGRWRYKEGSVEAIKAWAPQDQELARIAQTLAHLQAQYDNQLVARVSHSDRYCHEYSVTIDVDLADWPVDEDGDELEVDLQEVEEAVSEALRDLMRWLYRKLEEDYEYRNSEEVVDEALEDLGYEFLEDGSIYN